MTVVRPQNLEDAASWPAFILHQRQCPVLGHSVARSILKRFRWAIDGIRWMTQTFGQEEECWRRCRICLPSIRSASSSAGLRRLLAESSGGTQIVRDQLQDSIAEYGAAGIEALELWLEDRDLAPFAVTTIEIAARVDRDVALAVLGRAQHASDPVTAAAIRSALGRLDFQTSLWPDIPADARTVAFVGDGPFRSIDLAYIVSIPDLVRDPDNEGFIDTVVLGLEATLSSRIIDLIDQRPRPARFLPQEAWIELLLLGRDWWLRDTDRLNDMADRHAPLDSIRQRWPAAEFAWPGTVVSGLGQPMTVALGDLGILRALGYQITGHEHAERMGILRSDAIPRYGLRTVAETIASHVRRAKLRISADYSHAIREWELDLAGLRREEYAMLQPTFPWPDTGSTAQQAGPRSGPRVSRCSCGAIFRSPRYESEIEAHALGLCGLKGRATHRGPEQV